MLITHKARCIWPKSRGVSTQPGEKSDCTVRAAVNATGLPYQKVHDVLKFYGRQDGQGAEQRTWARAYRSLGLKLIGIFGKSKTAMSEWNMLEREYAHPVENYAGTSIKNFVKSHPRGTYVCLTHNHAFAIVRGELVDSTPLLLNTRITVAYEVVS
jgi:hypothetical protein